MLEKKINNSINPQIKIVNLRFHVNNQNENILHIKIKRKLRLSLYKLKIFPIKMKFNPNRHQEMISPCSRSISSTFCTIS